MSLVGDPIQQRRGQGGVPKDLGPVPKSEIRGDDDRLFLMAFREYLKQQLGALLGEGDVSQFIDDQQTERSIAFHHSAQELFVSGFDQFIGQSTAGDEAGPYPCRQASMPRAVARWVFPVPLRPGK